MWTQRFDDLHVDSGTCLLAAAVTGGEQDPPMGRGLLVLATRVLELHWATAVPEAKVK